MMNKPKPTGKTTHQQDRNARTKEKKTPFVSLECCSMDSSKTKRRRARYHASPQASTHTPLQQHHQKQRHKQQPASDTASDYTVRCHITKQKTPMISYPPSPPRPPPLLPLLPKIAEPCCSTQHFARFRRIGGVGGGVLLWDNGCLSRPPPASIYIILRFNACFSKRHV